MRKYGIEGHMEETSKMSDGRYRPACSCGWWGEIGRSYYCAQKRWIFHGMEVGAVDRHASGMIWKREDWK